MPKENEPWIAVKVGVRKNRKITALSGDTARYGWIAGVLAEAKLQRPGGRFESRGQLEESIGRFAAFVDEYLEVGLLELAHRLCSSCRKVWHDLPPGAYVVHDWRDHQRDPGAAERARDWRALQAGDLAEDMTDEASVHVNGDRTPDERGVNAQRTLDDLEPNAGSHGQRSANVTGDSRARAVTVTETVDSDVERDTPQPPGRAGGRPSRADGTSPRALAEAAAERSAAETTARRRRAGQRQQAYLRGAITGAQLEELNRTDAPTEDIVALPDGAAYPDTGGLREKVPAWWSTTGARSRLEARPGEAEPATPDAVADRL